MAEPTYWGRDHGGDIKIAATLHQSFEGTQNPDFTDQHDKTSFFRAGQVFAVRISSSLYLNSAPSFKKVDFGHLPLEPISKLKAIAEEDHLEGRQQRLAQIRALPLSLMTVHCDDAHFDRTRVECLLCDRKSFLKDDWTFHFQLEHWRYYFSMVPEALTDRLHKRLKKSLVPRNEIAQPPPDSSFSTDSWITIEDITEDKPIHTDEEIVSLVSNFSPRNNRYLIGPIMIQRFVVVSEGASSCLCLGIHTYGSASLTPEKLLMCKSATHDRAAEVSLIKSSSASFTPAKRFLRHFLMRLG